MSEENIQQKEETIDDIIPFQDQFDRLLLTWRQKAGVKTQKDLLNRLGASEEEYFKAVKKQVIPEQWLVRTANVLKIDVSFIRTGKSIVQ